MIEALAERLARLRREAMALIGQAGDFPAINRNGRRLLVSLRMMEIDLGLLPPEPSEELLAEENA
ncbi:MAG: hypothetical protein ACOZHQ_14565 [Thermodesulfobacteriota bacterium]